MGADILASVSSTAFWSRNEKLNFDKYCDALMIPGSELLVLLSCFLMLVDILETQGRGAEIDTIA